MVIMNNVNTTERLIQEVRARPPLWDQRNLNYHNRIVVNALWQDIADLLQVNSKYNLFYIISKKKEITQFYFILFFYWQQIFHRCGVFATLSLSKKLLIVCDGRYFFFFYSSLTRRHSIDHFY